MKVIYALTKEEEESLPNTGYITAVSLEDYHVLWKTEPLACNSLNFEITGDVILCGGVIG